MMTERFEITTLLQKELVNDPEVFGKVDPGSPEQPSVYMESVHHLMKMVAGAPNLRPTWFFDREQQGEGVNDIGTHLVDLVPWTLWPGQGIDPKKEIQILSAQRWPTLINRAQLPAGDGGEGLPGRPQEGRQERHPRVLLQHAGHLHGAGRAHQAQHHLGLGSPRRQRRHPLRLLPGQQGAHRGPPGQGRERYRPETYVVPNDAKDRAAILAAVTKRLGDAAGQVSRA